jgi:hypothetical protein
MYRCQKCNEVSKSGEGQHKVVTQTRPKQYLRDEFLVGEGTEIVTEMILCESCATGKSLEQS